MTAHDLDAGRAARQELLGYLNFSSGSTDPQFLRRLNELVGSLESGHSPETNIVGLLAEILQDNLRELAGRSAAFSDVEQAQSVIRLALVEFPPRYREFHRDLLFHQADRDLWRPLFLGRMFEAILEQGPPWGETERIISAAIARLNDYIGHRPVAVLHNQQRTEPYAHEWIRPIPLYIRGAGVSEGRYHAIVSGALAILQNTAPEILTQAYFDPALLDELAFDPRAYDFDHPVNKRPNYHFGQWDPHHIDNQGRYRRFVVQQVTLDVLESRIRQTPDLPREELILESAAVLAGTILMASGTSGSGPDSHDSSTTLTTLLPRIAAYRDAFYEQFVQGVAGQHGERLRAEAVIGKQPLAGVRQYLNQQLARRRASQLEHVHLALLYARMGYPQAALSQAQVVPVAAARMACEIQCRLTTSHLAIDRGCLDDAARMLDEIEDYLRRAIECGALADPWNILGFQGQFSLFPSPENSVPDHRLDQLVATMEQIVGLYARLWSEAAVRNEPSLAARLAEGMRRLTKWWDQFAPTSVEGLESFSGAEAYDSAREVADALRAFQEAGAAAGDIGFWRKRVSHFQSPKAYALVVDALLQKPDRVAAMALLLQWLSRADAIPLRQAEYSFHNLADRWLSDACRGGTGHDDLQSPIDPQARAATVRKFFELLEANAEDFWQVPSLELSASPVEESTYAASSDDDHDDAEDEDPELFRAAYDDVVYIDSTGDGVESDMLESGPAPATDFELEQEGRRAAERLTFLRTVASLWKKAVLECGLPESTSLENETLQRWLEQAVDNERQLLALLKAVSERKIPAPSASRDSLMEFDRRRGVKEMLIDKIIATTIETSDAARAMRAALPVPRGDKSEPLESVLRAAMRGDREEVEQQWPALLESLRTQPLLYVPLGKGGDPARLAQARTLQQALRDLLQWLPRLGLFGPTCQLIETARLMESANPVGPGAISEFDRLFAAGYEAIVDSLLTVSTAWAEADAEQADNDLIECLEQVTESLLRQWLAHSRTLRLSALERITDEKVWKAIVDFIQRYGSDLFTQRFLNLGNLRAILHRGVDAWLAELADDGEGEFTPVLLTELGGKISRDDAVKYLTIVIESVVENYAEYRDYNSTTTQSDRGDLLFTLLDFLRLRVHYDRVAWHLKPVMDAHAILVRRGRTAAAESWRRALAERTGELADSLQARCAELRKKYAMRLPTVSDRIGERFVRPLTVDRVQALVRPAMEEVRLRTALGENKREGEAFHWLEQEIEELTQEPTGVGLDVPAWLVALEQEVETQRRANRTPQSIQEIRTPIVQVSLSVEEVQNQLTSWESNSR